MFPRGVPLDVTTPFGADIGLRGVGGIALKFWRIHHSADEWSRALEVRTMRVVLVSLPSINLRVPA
jgi:hypothetical protein